MEAALSNEHLRTCPLLIKEDSMKLVEEIIADATAYAEETVARYPYYEGAERLIMRNLIYSAYVRGCTDTKNEEVKTLRGLKEEILNG